MKDIIERLQSIGEPDGYNARVADEAADEIKRLRAVLEKIANTDYRGNRSQESIIAYRALNDA